MESQSSALTNALDELRRAIIEAYRAIEAEGRRPSGGEYKRRRAALEGINEILQWPLGSFDAAHLELLEVLFGYWRELEIIARARSPDPIQ